MAYSQVDDLGHLGFDFPVKIDVLLTKGIAQVERTSSFFWREAQKPSISVMATPDEEVLVN